MVADTCGYDSIVRNWNAADAMPWFLADFDVKKDGYLRPELGMWAIPEGLCNLFEEAGGRINLTLRRVTRPA